MRNRRKACARCGRSQSLSQFHRRRASPDGLHTECKSCARARYRAERKTRIARTKAWKDQHPERVAVVRQREDTLYPEKREARRQLKNAVRRGDLSKPERSEVCDRPTPPVDLHAHHLDYDRPLEVEWLCRDCHVAEHRAELALN